MLLRQRQIAEWITDVPLTANETRIVEVGNVLSGQNVLTDSGPVCLTFCHKSSHNILLSIDGSHDQNFAIFDNLYNVAAVGATLLTPYSMAAPIGQAGYVVIDKPYIRFKLFSFVALIMTYTRFYAKAWS